MTIEGKRNTEWFRMLHRITAKSSNEKYEKLSLE